MNLERAIFLEIEINTSVSEVWNTREKFVLPRLKFRFDNGPVDWNNPPKFN
jgi:hypothetical protein